jgi:ABC-type methionine transport system permease subunit
MKTSYVSLVIMAAENWRSLVIEAMYSSGMMRRKILAQDVLPESRGPVTTNFLVFCGIL